MMTLQVVAVDFLVALLLLLLLSPLTDGNPIDNGVISDPVIECREAGIIITVSTEKTFQGRIYVKNHVRDPECVNPAKTSIEVNFDSPCGLTRSRSLQPPGLVFETTVVVSFHPFFVTKVDRAYRVRCLYQQNQKTVETSLHVSDLPFGDHTGVVPMPVCKYELLEGGPFGKPISFANVGTPIYHQWSCKSVVPNAFCMTVHSCVVDDGDGYKVDILDNEGCAIDRYLLNNLEYPEDLVAGQEAHVYKYADRDSLFIQCQIAINIKEPGFPCPIPECQPPPARRLTVDNQEVSSSMNITRRVLRSTTANVTAKSDWEVDVVVALEAIDNFDMPKNDFTSQSIKNCELCLTKEALKVVLILWMALFVLLTITILYLRCAKALIDTIQKQQIPKQWSESTISKV